MSALDDYKKLISRRASLTTSLATAKAVLEQKELEVQRIAAEAKSKFNVNSIEELQALCNSMDAQMAAVVAEVQAKAPHLLS